jgi:heme/copper-type cytochrome/quinol oxidase subunit 3
VIRVLRTAELPSVLSGGRSPLWWAVLLLVAIESMVFGSLFAGYFYLRIGHTVWPPPGIPLPDLLLPLINTGVLAASSGAVFYAMTSLKKGRMRPFKLWLGGGVVLEIIFLIIKVIESRDLGRGWSSHAYWSIYWSISGLHSIHVTAAIIMGVAVLILALRGYYTPERRVGVQAVSMYWQFVAIIWIPVVLMLYFVPRWF